MANLPYKERPTRFPKGSTNNDPRHTLGRVKFQDPHKSAVYASDFHTFASGDWTATTVGTGTNALVAGDGGILAMVTSAAAADSNILTKLPAAFTMVAGYQNWFRISLNLSDATNTQMIAGFVNAITTYTPTDGIFFSKADGSTTIVGNFSVGSVNTTVTLPSTVAANATQIVLGAHYDGDSKIQFFVNDAVVASLAVSSSALPAVNLTPAFGVKSGAAAGIKTMNVDLVLAAKDRADLIFMN